MGSRPTEQAMSRVYVCDVGDVICCLQLRGSDSRPDRQLEPVTTVVCKPKHLLVQVLC